MKPTATLILIPLVPMLLLAACDSPDAPTADAGSVVANEGLSIRIDGKERLAANVADDTVSVNLPGFSAKVKVPDVKLDTGNIDIGGIDLYPGSRVASVDVDAGRGDGAPDRVRIAFASPDAPARLLDYYRKAAADRGFALTASPGGAIGFTAAKPDEDGFRLELAPIAGGGTQGRIIAEDRR